MEIFYQMHVMAIHSKSVKKNSSNLRQNGRVELVHVRSSSSLVDFELSSSNHTLEFDIHLSIPSTSYSRIIHVPERASARVLHRERLPLQAAPQVRQMRRRLRKPVLRRQSRTTKKSKCLLNPLWTRDHLLLTFSIGKFRRYAWCAATIPNTSSTWTSCANAIVQRNATDCKTRLPEQHQQHQYQQQCK